LRSRIDLAARAFALVGVLAIGAMPGVVRADSGASSVAPATAALDARARAEGNRLDLARRIGAVLFRIEWPAQVLKVQADEVQGRIVVGLIVSGVKFHHPLTRAAFLDEVAALIRGTFAADRRIEETDVWAIVPVRVHPGEIVSGPLAQPTARTVFSASVLRSDLANLADRLENRDDVYLDQEWARTTFEPRG
jgi:hypothetical protein